jgi:hypothetical protein
MKDNGSKSENIHHGVQGKGSDEFLDQRNLKKRPLLSRLTSYSRYSSDTTLSHPVFRRKPSAYLYACQDQVSCI